MRFFSVSSALLTTSLMAAPLASPAWAARPSFLPKPLAPFLQNFDPTKKTVCTMTINSSEEKDTFQKSLDPNHFNFVEFVRPADSINPQAPATQAQPASTQKAIPGNWFKRACDSGVRCDILVISGHFGGRYFGSSGQHLSLDELEGASCRNDCGGILSNAKEVFLFGCNTLAGKEKDHRSQPEYVEVLVRDGYTRADAEAIAEARYGTFGAENKDRMKRTFQGVPYLYGFSSVGPTGKRVQPLLMDYFSKVGPYETHLETITPEKTAESSPNAVLGNALRYSAFTQCRGIDPKDPAFVEKSHLCALGNKSLPAAEKARIMNEILNSDRVLAFLPAIYGVLFPDGVLTTDEKDLALVEIVKKNARVKDLLLRSMAALKTPLLKMDWLQFALGLGWINPEEFRGHYVSLGQSLLQAPISRENADAFCSLSPPAGVKVNPEEFAPLLSEADFDSEGGVQAIMCAGFVHTARGAEIVLRFLKNHQAVTNSKLVFLLAPLSGMLPGDYLRDRFTIDPALAPVQKSALEEGYRICATRIGPYVNEVCGMLLSSGNPAGPEAFEWASKNFGRHNELSGYVDQIFAANPQVHLPYVEQIVSAFERRFINFDQAQYIESAFFKSHALPDGELLERIWKVLEAKATSRQLSLQDSVNVVEMMRAFKGSTLYQGRVEALALTLLQLSKDSVFPATESLAESVLEACLIRSEKVVDQDIEWMLNTVGIYPYHVPSLKEYTEQLDACGWGARIKKSVPLAENLMRKVATYNDLALSEVPPVPPSVLSALDFNIWPYIAPPGMSESEFRNLLVTCSEGKLYPCNLEMYQPLRDSARRERASRGY